MAAAPGKVRFLACQQHLAVGRRDPLTLQVDHVGVIFDQAAGHRATRQDEARPQGLFALVSRAKAGRVPVVRVQAAPGAGDDSPAVSHVSVKLGLVCVCHDQIVGQHDQRVRVQVCLKVDDIELDGQFLEQLCRPEDTFRDLVFVGQHLRSHQGRLDQRL